MFICLICNRGIFLIPVPKNRSSEHIKHIKHIEYIVCSKHRIQRNSLNTTNIPNTMDSMEIIWNEYKNNGNRPRDHRP